LWSCIGWTMFRQTFRTGSQQLTSFILTWWIDRPLKSIRYTEKRSFKAKMHEVDGIYKLLSRGLPHSDKILRIDVAGSVWQRILHQSTSTLNRLMCNQWIDLSFKKTIHGHRLLGHDCIKNTQYYMPKKIKNQFNILTCHL